MNTEQMRSSALAAAAAILASVALTGAAAAGVSQYRVQAELVQPQTRQIATSTLGRELRVSLTAVRSTNDELAASVRLSTYRFADGAWVLEDRARVGDRDGWFWFPLTGRDAVCRFATSSVRPERIGVSLTITPSIGCSDTLRFHIDNGEIVSG